MKKQAHDFVVKEHEYHPGTGHAGCGNRLAVVAPAHEVDTDEQGSAIFWPTHRISTMTPKM